MRVAVLGLGEAGSLLAADLAGGGEEVNGYDPARVPDIEGVNRHETAESAVAECGLVMTVTAASQAVAVLERVAPHLEHAAIYADLSTGSPGLKEALAEVAAGQGAWFADVALMGPVPGSGLATPALASGSGADRYADLINARGGRVEVVGERAGTAAARKLLRSVVTKGLAALLIESTAAATRYGDGEWLWRHLIDQLGSIDTALLERLLFDTAAHAGRRLDEMEAARDMLIELGARATMTTATVAHLRLLIEEGVPEIATGS